MKGRVVLSELESRYLPRVEWSCSNAAEEKIFQVSGWLCFSAVVTAYTYPSAVHVDIAGIDALLVGDSVGMVELGYDSTLPVTMEDLIYHCKAVSRGADRALLVADLPFGSYEASPAQAYASAIRFLKEANMDCVKVRQDVLFQDPTNLVHEAFSRSLCLFSCIFHRWKAGHPSLHTFALASMGELL